MGRWSHAKDRTFLLYRTISPGCFETYACCRADVCWESICSPETRLWGNAESWNLESRKVSQQQWKFDLAAPWLISALWIRHSATEGQWRHDGLLLKWLDGRGYRLFATQKRNINNYNQDLSILRFIFIMIYPTYGWCQIFLSSFDNQIFS